MPVYLVVEKICNETTIHGAFSRRENAEAWISRRTAEYDPHFADDACVQELAVDAGLQDRLVYHYGIELIRDTAQLSDWPQNGKRQTTFEPPFTSDVVVYDDYIHARSTVSPEHALEVAKRAAVAEPS